MKKTAIIFALLTVMVASAFTIATAWNVVEGTTVSFELPDEGTKGTIGGLKASFNFDPKDPGTASISASVDVKTFNSGNQKKDDHLKSADFFNADKYPTMSFVSKSVKVSGDGFIASGSLTVKDSTKAVEIPFSFKEEASGAAAFKGSLTIFAGDYGVMKKSSSGKDKVVITLNIPVKK